MAEDRKELYAVHLPPTVKHYNCIAALHQRVNECRIRQDGETYWRLQVNNVHGVLS